MKQPRTFLSIDGTNTRIIHNGAPMGPDRSLEITIEIAARDNCELAPVLWDGDAGQYRSLYTYLLNRSVN
jgi:hypothetical protein